MSPTSVSSVPDSGPAVIQLVTGSRRRPRLPRSPGYDTDQAVADLTAADPKLGQLIAAAGPFTMKLASTQSPFEALLEAIIYQQLHGKAAAAIHLRLIESFAAVAGGRHPDPQHLLDCPNEQLRAAGLSHNKALAVRDLAAKTIDGTVPSLARIRRMSDDAIIEHLTQVRGIGRWTVEMMLIFRLGRPNVLPVDDYGIRKGFALTFQGLKPSQKVTPALLPKPDVMRKRAKRWQPWCSVASWYMYRACDLAAKSVAKSLVVSNDATAGSPATKKRPSVKKPATSKSG